MSANGPPDTRLHGRWLVAARLGWLAVAALAIGLYAASIPANVDERAFRCAAPPCLIGRLTPQEIDALPRLGLSLGAYAWYNFLLFNAAITLAWLAMGLLIFRRRSDDRMGLFTALMLVTFVPAITTGTRLTAGHPPLQFAHGVLVAIGMWSVATFLCLFPDGRFVPRWTRWLALALLIQQGLLWLAMPLAASADHPLARLTWFVYFGIFAVAAGAQVYRYRRVSTPRQRQQTRWIAVALPLVPLSDLGVRGVLLPALFPALARPGLGHVVYEMITIPLFGALPFVLVPVAFAVAILRHRLFAIDVLIRRALVYGGLTAAVVGIYALVVGALGALFQARGDRAAALVATGVVAVAFGPLRDRLQRGVDRLLYGERDNPYAVLSRLGQRLEGTMAQDAVVPMIVGLIAQAMKLPYAAIALAAADDRSSTTVGAEWTVIAASGRPPAYPLIAMPLVYQGVAIGELRLAPRGPQEPLTPADRRLLDDLARQAGIAVHATCLTADLQRARARLVTAREEERRRLRRDLHDGLGPQLAGFTLRLDVVRRLLREDPAAAEAVVLDLKARSREVVADIRRLVYALRPPALDELGLVAAVRQQVAQYADAGHRFTLDAPAGLPPLPAAVEVAAYRIAQEALTNVVRHAEARSCTVRLALDERGGALCLEIADDGRGLPSPHAGPLGAAGVGLVSMRERAAELGGTWVAEARPGGGTRILARLPVVGWPTEPAGAGGAARRDEEAS